MKGYHFAIFEASSCLQTHDRLAALRSDNFCDEKARVLKERKSTCEDFQLFLLLKPFITHRINEKRHKKFRPRPHEGL